MEVSVGEQSQDSPTSWRRKLQPLVFVYTDQSFINTAALGPEDGFVISHGSEALVFGMAVPLSTVHIHSRLPWLPTENVSILQEVPATLWGS